MSEKPHKDEEYDPYMHRKVEHPISNTDTIIHLLKSSFGTGMFLKSTISADILNVL